MGRKSSKAKEKKQKRLEERAAMDAVCAKVDAANRVMPNLTLLGLSTKAFLAHVTSELGKWRVLGGCSWF
ncbi:NAA40 isoform 5 [Pan troglodytes]|uniref:NAA40 isoform 5 n=1 Tax=Pan troglodytes TaxID=9598 RepID=A0A2J8QD38_PANTR|nr:NAA40 isoform 5 [Pan troglodytes]